LRLGSPFVTNAGVVQLAARDRRDRDHVLALRTNDVILIAGRTTTNAVVTAGATLKATPHAVSVGSPVDGNGNPLFAYYEADTTGAGEVNRWGLRNGTAAAAGVTIGTDAAVAVLHRDGGVVTYATATESIAGSGQRISLLRIVGDPAAADRS